MDKVIVREASLKDLKDLLRFEQELIEAERPFDPTIRPSPLHYYDLEKLIKDKQIGIYVAEYKGKLISSGYGMARKARHYLDHEEYAYLGFMYTVPEYRGKGVNFMILDALKMWVNKQGLTELRLTVYDENIPAIKAYEKAGFQKHIVEMRLREK
ncbi:GNAT family N-acetyltransferase [Poritiphilus sp. M415]|uniref:GNAT family N-acetyltransferase n=1 Tax=Lentiprolixibacter aurantiacus TaxID=2993939 RepID=A0AAE3MKT6_9FLAO|nr:GNAT family N-acetyltransferase [Lentiprolixibacter aurantiacus]MCX2719253.1 GNAT family N-acetyltransferase [Lentiprolixibacter aurantiacus]